MIDTTSRAAIGVLKRELGWSSTISVGLAIFFSQRRQRPFGDLAPATDAKERGSRDQAGPAILLYRALLKRMSGTDALELTQKVVDASAVAFLQQTIGPLNRQTLQAMSAEERMSFVRLRLDRFPNMTYELHQVDPDTVRFTVNSCRLHSLAVHAGHPELGSTFCSGDARFFGDVQPDVTLERSTTLASGGASCPFVLRLRADIDKPR
ncbi:MAG: putative ArsR family transcriptional regulator [Kiritimatiellia bacterium]|jgi:predicted ArsR family transcriptional regulator